jgi:hypothetical protein
MSSTILQRSAYSYELPVIENVIFIPEMCVLTCRFQSQFSNVLLGSLNFTKSQAADSDILPSAPKAADRSETRSICIGAKFHIGTYTLSVCNVTNFI